MKILYIDCGMGAAGDMLTAALLELLPDGEQDAFIKQMNSLGLEGVEMRREKAVRCGIMGTHVAVTIGGSEEESIDDSGQSHEHDEGHDHGHDSHTHSHGHKHTHDHEGMHRHSHEDMCGHEYESADSCDHTHEHKSDHVHSHTGIRGIEHIVRDHMDIPEKSKDDIMEVFDILAHAESEVHGVGVDEIHFHEVGTMDAVADIAAVCLLLEKLSPDRIIVSPIHVGSGYVRCAHGILPVPAPATANILRGVPIYSTDLKGELCTPTGAALLKHFADEYGNIPVMKTETIGYGMGKKDFPKANCVRVLMGESV